MGDTVTQARLTSGLTYTSQHMNMCLLMGKHLHIDGNVCKPSTTSLFPQLPWLSLESPEPKDKLSVKLSTLTIKTISLYKYSKLKSLQPGHCPHVTLFILAWDPG